MEKETLNCQLMSTIVDEVAVLQKTRRKCQTDQDQEAGAVVHHQNLTLKNLQKNKTHEKFLGREERAKKPRKGTPKLRLNVTTKEKTTGEVVRNGTISVTAEMKEVREADSTTRTTDEKINFVDSPIRNLREATLIH